MVTLMSKFRFFPSRLCRQKREQGENVRLFFSVKPLSPFPLETQKEEAINDDHSDLPIFSLRRLITRLFALISE